MRVLDLFSGIGGFSLGLERAGMSTIAFCEIDAFARGVLAHHWPKVPIHDDVRSVRGALGSADLICGGFPCQDISFAGKGAGLDGARSGLWWEYHRIIAEVRPRWVVAENVSALRSRGLDVILGSLAAIGYDAEWHCVPASAIGAPHRRDRIWIVAYPQDVRGPAVEREQPDGAGGVLVDPAGERWIEGRAEPVVRSGRSTAAGASGVGLADADKPRLEGLGRLLERARERSAWADGEAIEGGRLVKPGVRLLAHGVPRRVDSLRCLGNAVVPQIPEAIGRAIMEWEASRP